MVTQKRLKELFEHEAGNLIWKIENPNAKRGYVAGCLDKRGYRFIRVDDKLYTAHRLVWFYHNGYFPENDIDHINRNKDDNRIENLREVSRSCNNRNTGNHCTNKSGVKGVHWFKRTNKWKVEISVMNKSRYLGYYNDFDEAVLARLAGEQCLEWNGCDSSSPAYQYAIRYGLIRQKV